MSWSLKDPEDPQDPKDPMRKFEQGYWQGRDRHSEVAGNHQAPKVVRCPADNAQNKATVDRVRRHTAYGILEVV